MNDDEFPNIIGSGTEHHVSVSERTGNAKTPQNHVTSHELETEARKHNFEAQELAALEEKKALAAALAEHTAQLAALDTSADDYIQKIAVDKDIKNRQTITNDSATKANVQSLPTDTTKANVQTVGSDTQKDNIQSLTSEKGNAPNQQTIDKGPALAANRQTIGQQPSPPNVQGIPTDTSASNQQKITKVDGQDNQQPIDQNGLGPNRQPVGLPPAIGPNKQAVAAHDPSLNRQGVDNGNLQSHFEALPSGNNQPGHVNPAANMLTADAPHKSAAKLAPAPRAPMTAQELEDAQRKREKFSDEFHGRLAGIKHNVDELNDRLTDFEEKTQKDDAKLIKGNPNDFKVDLG